MIYNVCVHWGEAKYNVPMLEIPEPSDLLGTGIFVGRVERKATTKTPVLYPFPTLIRDFTELKDMHDFQFTIEDVQLFGRKNTTLDFGMSQYINISDFYSL